MQQGVDRFNHSKGPGRAQVLHYRQWGRAAKAPAVTAIGSLTRISGAGSGRERIDARVDKTADELMSQRFGGGTVRDNIRDGIETGDLVEDADGRLRVRLPTDRSTSWARAGQERKLNCQFSINFLFPYVYKKTAVPMGCRACFKVKVVPKTLRQLVAAWGMAKEFPWRSKWGVDIDNAYSQDIYLGLFYVGSLEEARAVHGQVRTAIDAHPLLGPQIAMSIKRGCTDYEVALGPSDKFEFAPERAALEERLFAQFRETTKSGPRPVPLAHWIDVAFRIGDETYRDFTGGRRLRPGPLAYDP
jgi:hypothetical protein